MTNKELVGKIIEASNFIEKKGRFGTANCVVCGRENGEIINNYVKVKKLKGYDIVADPGFEDARMELRPEDYYWSDSPVGVSGSSGIGVWRQEPMGQKFSDIDPFGEENWEN